VNPWLRHALRDLARNRGFSLFFIANLALGLTGFIAIHSFSTSLERYLSANLRTLLTADLAVSASRPFTREEEALLDDVLGPDRRSSSQAVFYTMVKGASGSRLTQVLAVDRNYPLYGSLDFEIPADQGRLQDHPEIAMTREAALTFGIRPGDSVTLGSRTFVFRHLLRTDPDRSLASVDLAPKLYMGLDQLRDTDLVQFGSRVRHLKFFRFPEDRDVPALKESLKARLEILFQGHPVISVFDVRDMSRGLGRITRLFGGYLGLVSSIALFMAGIAGAYLFRGYLDRRVREIAVVMSLGARRRDVLVLYTAQVLILGAAASLLALSLSRLLLPAFPLLLKGIIPAGLAVTTQPSTVAMAVAMGVTGSLLFCLPVFQRLFAVTPLDLLRGVAPPAPEGRRRRFAAYLASLPALAGFFALAALLTHSLNQALVFTLGLSGVMACLALTAVPVFRTCRRLSRSGRPVVKIAFRNLYRNSVSSLACFVTIALGTFLISLIPQVQKGLQDELVRPDGLKVPVFFLVDIQEEQKQDLTAFVQERGAVVSAVSPMIRGRILSVNGDNFHQRQKEAARTDAGRQFRRLEFNFSYRQDLDDSETITRGKPLSPEPWDPESGPFEISLAEEFAEWYAVTLGDTLTADIQGIQLTGRVKNIRKVRWNSFQPNFFLLFQNGVLDDAPKTFLASVSRVAPEDRPAFRDAVSETFSNVSVIDVTQTVTTLLSITDQISLSVKFMALLAMGAGLVSIFSIARLEARNGQRQILLLKVLGCGFREIRAIGLIESGVIGLSSSAAAVSLSLGASWAVSWTFFDRLWALSPGPPLALVALTTLTAMATAWIASRRTLAEKPSLLLNSGS
jgi:putative ABC transport system permease protein